MGLTLYREKPICFIQSLTSQTRVTEATRIFKSPD
jgi:hypothetical protein